MTPDFASLSNGRFDQTTRADLQTYLDGLDSSGRKLVAHFHGGLVNRAAGLRIADRLRPVYEQAGGYPLFFVWQSGLGETIIHNLRDIADEKIFKRLLARVVQFAVGKVNEEITGMRGLTVELPDLEGVYETAFDAAEVEPYAELPERASVLSPSQELQLERVLRADPVIQDETARIANSLQDPREEDVDGTRGARIRGSTSTLMSPEVLEEIIAEAGDEGGRGVITTTRIVTGAIATVTRVLVRLHAGRGHGVYTTAVEELLRELYLTNAGGLLWEQMKKDTEDAFGHDPNRFGGTALVEELVTRTPASPPVLVGHSTGAVYICNLLAHADTALPPERTFDVVLLAPACDFRLMDETFARHGRRIGRLRIFCMSDEKEREDRLVPVVYPRSLLYFVSGTLEAKPDWPLLGMQRFYMDGPPFGGADFPEIKRVRDAIAAKPESEVWSIAAGGSGLASDAVHHGDFDDDAATLQSVQHFISSA